MFFSDNLRNIDHCFFSRLGGVSLNNYKSLNCGPGSNDYKPYIQKNRLAVSKYFNLSSKHLVTLYQTHSNKVGVLKSNNLKEIYMNDGIVTKQKNMIIGIINAIVKDSANAFKTNNKINVYACSRKLGSRK